MNDRFGFRALATKEYHTHNEIISIGDWVIGYYYFCRERNTGIIITDMSEECGGIDSGIVQVEVEVNRKTKCKSTGLKDKNGKLIYFSDYIKHENYIYLVFWNKYEISCKNIRTNDIIPIADLYPDFSEVIGNEFENRKEVIG